MSDLVLNGLRKPKGSVLLEEHSSCEVPAGCGGVVLRWVTADSPALVDVRVTIAATAHELWIDGVSPERTRCELAPGPHVLALHIPAPRAGGLLIAWLQLTQRKADHEKVVSSPDGSWRATLTAPSDDGWRSVQYDDAGWFPLVDREIEVDATDKVTASQRTWLQRSGAVSLGTPVGLFERVFGSRPPAAVWVRRTFVLDAGGLR